MTEASRPLPDTRLRATLRASGRDGLLPVVTQAGKRRALRSRRLPGSQRLRPAADSFGIHSSELPPAANTKSLSNKPPLRQAGCLSSLSRQALTMWLISRPTPFLWVAATVAIVLLISGEAASRSEQFILSLSWVFDRRSDDGSPA